MPEGMKKFTGISVKLGNYNFTITGGKKFNGIFIVKFNNSNDYHKTILKAIKQRRTKGKFKL
jgi:hypothetical protein